MQKKLKCITKQSKIVLNGESKCCSKGHISVISSEPLCTDGNARFTTVFLKPLSDNVINIVGFYVFYWSRNAQVTFVEKSHLKIFRVQN